MDVDTSSGRWENIQKLLTRGSPLAHPDFEPSDEVLMIYTQLTFKLFYFAILTDFTVHARRM